MNAKQFLNISRRYPDLRIAVVGDFFLDRYLHIDPARGERSLETGLAVHNVVEVRDEPGAAGTILNNLSALGVGAIHAVGFCGDDGEGHELRRALAARPGVVLDNFVTTRHRRTPVYRKPMLIEAGRPPRELNRLDSKNWSPTPEPLQRELAERVLSLAGAVDAVLLLDQVDRPESGAVTGPVRKAAHRALELVPDLVVLADSRRGLQDFPPLGFKMNADELARMSGAARTNDVNEIAKFADALSHHIRQPVFITMAERGIIGAGRGASAAHVSAFPVRGPIDIVGAGDAVTANLAAALASRANLREAMEAAMAAASIVIHQLGTTGTASIDQIQGLLNMDLESAPRA